MCLLCSNFRSMILKWTEYYVAHPTCENGIKLYGKNIYITTITKFRNCNEVDR